MEDVSYIIFFTLAAIIIVVANFVILYIRQKKRIANSQSVGNTQKIVDKKAGKDTNNADREKEKHPDFTGMKPRALCKAVLHELNCRVVEDENDSNHMQFTFQGEEFSLIASDDCLLVTVYDISWGNVSLDDIDDVSRLRKTINNINLNYGGVTAVYTIDSDHNKMLVHTKRQFIMTPEIPGITAYMTAMLTGFFHVQRALTQEMDRLRMKDNKDNK